MRPGFLHKLWRWDRPSIAVQVTESLKRACSFCKAFANAASPWRVARCFDWDALLKAFFVQAGQPNVFTARWVLETLYLYGHLLKSVLIMDFFKGWCVRFHTKPETSSVTAMVVSIAGEKCERQQSQMPDGPTSWCRSLSEALDQPINQSKAPPVRQSFQRAGVQCQS